MRSHGIVVPTPGLDDYLRLAATAEPFHAQAFVAESPLKLSSEPFCHGLPGSISAVWMPAISSHSRIALLTNSGRCRNAGARCATFADQSGKHFDHTAGTDAAGDIDGQALAGELVDHGEALQALAVGAVVEQEVVSPDVVRPRGRQRTGTGARRAATWPPSRQLQACKTPEAMRTMSTHVMPLTAQEDPNPPIAVARVLCGQPSHRLQRRRVAFGSHGAVAQRRSGNLEQLAGTPLRQAAFACERDLLAPRLRAHHFRRLISLSVSISRSRSARMRLSFAFSVSRPRRRLMSVGSRGAEVTTPVVDGLLTDLVLLGDLGDRGLVSFAQDRDHLLFGEAGFLRRLLASCGSHSLKLRVGRRSWAGQAEHCAPWRSQLGASERPASRCF